MTAGLDDADTRLALEIARTLAMSADEIAVLAETIAKSPQATIEPAPPGSDPLGRQAVRALETERSRGISDGLLPGEIIGEGGMGLVRAAVQRSLGRRVAVKTLRPEISGEDATLRLVREAWVTGSLEHPNIVPIYDLGLDERGAPVIVLKHIEGAPWSDLLAELDRERGGDDEALERHLRLLLQVSNAVSLAHARGIVHRDLKPENVMIGRFGEVYVVDWGIAVSVRDDPTGRLPLASEAAELAGTPAYMAPEMLGGMGRVSERTDVYLLGAVLYEILTGRPPHVGHRWVEIAGSILRSEPVFPERVPEELAAIATRAMRRSPEERYASVDELRGRIEWYLRHRGSLALSAEAARRVAEMREVRAQGGEPSAVRARIHRLFAEARFGFRQAAKESDDNDAARGGLRDATEIIVDYELEEGTAEAAAAALAELESPPPELAQRVAVAMRAREVEKRRIVELEQLEAQLDPSIGRRTRRFASGAIAVIWTLGPEAIQAANARWPAHQYTTMVAATLLLMSLAGGVAFWGRASLSKTALNRQIFGALAHVFAAQVTLQVGAWLLGLSADTAWVLHLYAWFLCASAFTISVERRLAVASVAFLGCFLVAARLPHHTFRAMTIGNLVLLVNVLVAWRGGRTQAHTLTSDRVVRR